MLARGGIVARRAAQGFDEARNGGQRRAQFVADVGHEFRPHLPRFFQRRHIVEGEDRAHSGVERRDRHVVKPLPRLARCDMARLRGHAGLHDSLDPVEKGWLTEHRRIVPTQHGTTEKPLRSGIERRESLVRTDDGAGHRNRPDESIRIHFVAAFAFAYPFECGRATAPAKLLIYSVKCPKVHFAIYQYFSHTTVA